MVSHPPSTDADSLPVLEMETQRVGTQCWCSFPKSLMVCGEGDAKVGTPFLVNLPPPSSVFPSSSLGLLLRLRLLTRGVWAALTLLGPVDAAMSSRERGL